MREIKIIKQKITDNDYIVFPVSYINPLAKMALLEGELANNIKGSCKILVDLLLCNGENYNRFVSLKFDGVRIDRESIEIVELSIIEQKCVNKFYRDNTKTITKGTLAPSEYIKYIRA